MKSIAYSLPCKQYGVVLIISLVLLFTLTLIAVSSMGTSRLEQQMTANMRDRQIAFQAAETALRDGERFVQNATKRPDVTTLISRLTTSLFRAHISRRAHYTAGLSDGGFNAFGFAYGGLG